MKELLIGWVPVNTGTVVVGDPGNIAEVEWEEVVARSGASLGPAHASWTGAFIARVLGGGRPASGRASTTLARSTSSRITLSAES